MTSYFKNDQIIERMIDCIKKEDYTKSGIGNEISFPEEENMLEFIILGIIACLILPILVYWINQSRQQNHK